jgi:dynactin complex subunit
MKYAEMPMHTDEVKYGTALAVATSMLLTVVHDLEILRHEIDDNELKAHITQLASATNGVARMVIDVMPEKVQKQLDEAWAKMAQKMNAADDKLN